MPLIDLSFGDSLDRLSVLRVKEKFLSFDEKKIKPIRIEQELLTKSILAWCNENNISNSIFEEHLALLMEINEAGWIQIEAVRKHLDESTSSSNLHNEHLKMISINDERIKRKNDADSAVNYKFYEVKSYLK